MTRVPDHVRGTGWRGRNHRRTGWVGEREDVKGRQCDPLKETHTG